jgi:hypothetical protein
MCGDHAAGPATLLAGLQGWYRASGATHSAFGPVPDIHMARVRAAGGSGATPTTPRRP